MIKVGKLTDYAVVVMGQLSGDGPRSAVYLADKTGIPEPTVAKVLKLLSKGGLLDSARGAAGGYRLSRAAAEISVADIITAMEGPIAITSCAEGGDTSCKSAGQCPTRGHWDRVNTLIRSALQSIPLSEMTGQPTRFVQVKYPEAHVDQR